MTWYRTPLGKFELGIISCAAIAAVFFSLLHGDKSQPGTPAPFPPKMFGETLVSTIGSPKSTDTLLSSIQFPPIGTRYVTFMAQQYQLEKNDNVLTALYYGDASTKSPTGILIYSRPAK